MKIRVHPSFVAFLFVYTFFGGISSYLLSFLAVLIHEFSHLLIAHIAGEKELSLTLMPYGATLSLSGGSGKTLAILLAGPAGNLIASSAALAFSWLFPEIFGFMRGFVRANLSIALVNLIPAYPLDGGRMIRELVPRGWARRLTSAMTAFASAGFFALFFIGKMQNLTLLTFGAFTMAYFVSFAVKCPVKAVTSDPLFSVIKTDEEGKLRNVVVKGNGGICAKLGSEDLQRLALKYPADAPLGEILQAEERG